MLFNQRLGAARVGTRAVLKASTAPSTHTQPGSLCLADPSCARSILKLADFGLARTYLDEGSQKMTNRVITLWYRWGHAILLLAPHLWANRPPQWEA